MEKEKEITRFKDAEKSTKQQRLWDSPGYKQVLEGVNVAQHTASDVRQEKPV